MNRPLQLVTPDRLQIREGGGCLSVFGIPFFGGLAFGRSWTTIDRAQREVLKQWGLLVPLRRQSIPLEGYTAVTLGFVQGDSDSADTFPLTLKARSGADLPLCSLTQYAKARECARAIAEHLHMQIEVAATVTSRVEKIVSRLTRFARGKGVIIKTRTGLTTFGAGLDDAEVRYLHSIIRRTLIE